jgi:hypothetical protein
LDTRAGGEVDDRVGTELGHQRLGSLGVPDIQLDQPTPGAAQRRSHVGLLDRPGIGRIEVVDYGHFHAGVQDSVDQVRP